jgi:hypothetical protein
VEMLRDGRESPADIATSNDKNADRRVESKG